MRTGAIRRSLTNSIWTDDELATLRKSIEIPEPHGERWKDVMIGEQAIGLSAIEFMRSNPNESLDSGASKLFPLTPSGEKIFLEYRYMM